ncbi:MAG: nuclear transport factor 2 family protein [Sphingobium sp.]
MADAELIERIGLLEAHAAIADLIHRYALNIRTGRAADSAALFTADGEFVVRDVEGPRSTEFNQRTHAVGREALLAYIGGSSSSNFQVVPLIRNILIDVTGDTATSTCLMNSRSWPAGAEVFGHYLDSFRKEDGEWRFASRIFTIVRKPV